MKTVRIGEAQSQLPELVESLAGGQEVVITRDDKAIARLTSPNSRPSLSDIQPASVGAVLRPLSIEDDLLEEMAGG